MSKKILLFTSVLFLNGCASLPTTPIGFNAKTIETEHLSFYTLEKENIQKGKPIRFYIEGDGNPNPTIPVALKLAQKDEHENIIYLTRACQYIENDLCNNKDLYTTARFHQEIVNEMQELSLYFIKKYQAPHIEFVGYDGGAAFAIVLGSRIPITSQVITIAGTLNTSNQKNLHEETVNPFDHKDLIAHIPQVHYVGGQDTISPRRTAERFVGRLKNPRSAKVKVLPTLSHKGWENVSFTFLKNE
ncbi:MAG: hypothetical protein IKV03_01595 [Alphaproteobacteria bacterium]|nr:hypothetical protein [Alphaproteobacteria bacterium]